MSDDGESPGKAQTYISKAFCHDIICYDVICYDVTCYDVYRYDVIWYDVICYDVTWPHRRGMATHETNNQTSKTSSVLAFMVSPSHTVKYRNSQTASINRTKQHTTTEMPTSLESILRHCSYFAASDPGAKLTSRGFPFSLCPGISGCIYYVLRCRASLVSQRDEGSKCSVWLTSQR